MTKMRHLFYLSLIVCTAFLVSCETSEWPKDEKNKLLKRCSDEGGSKSYCKCYLKNAMAQYPNPEDIEEIDFESAVELAVDCP